MNHLLHVTVANELQQRLDGRGELIRDEACGGNQQLPLFIGTRRGRDTRMCNVDLLVVSSGCVMVVVEIEESGFIPTKICGKFLQAALATHFIHDSRPELALPYASSVLFVQVLDSTKWPKSGTRKDSQAELIEHEIDRRLPLPDSRITTYRLRTVSGPSDQAGLDEVGTTVLQALA